MYAIVDIAGQQFKVEKTNKVFVHRLENEEGSQVNFDKVLLIDNEGKVTIGEPVINGACIVAKVVSHVKGDKVLVFKKKRRKGYQVMNGHRQYFTEIIIEDILESGYKAASKPVAKKAEAKPAAKKAEAKPTAAKEAIKAEAEVAPKAEKTEKAATKTAPKAVAKKPVAKKAAPKAETKKTTAKAAPKKSAKADNSKK